MAARDDAFETWVAVARSADILAEAQARGASLRRAGSEYIGPCPACGGRDRFGINTAKRVFHCRGSGAGGDVIALVEYLDGCDFKTAVTTLAGPASSSSRGEEAGKRRGRPQEAWRSEGPTGTPGIDRQGSIEIARRLEESHAREQAQARDQAWYRERERKRAWTIWRAAKPIEPGSIAARYFERRGLNPPTFRSFRWLPQADYYRQARGWEKARVIWQGPAVVAAILDQSGTFKGVHVTHIDPETCGKVRLPDPDKPDELLPAKKVRGSQTGGHIPMNHVERPTRLIVGEGIETVLSVMQSLPPDPNTLFWSAVSLGNLGGKAARTVPHPTKTKTDKRGAKRKVRVPGPEPAIQEARSAEGATGNKKNPDGRPSLMPPETVTDVVLLADSDSDRFTVECALTRTASRWAADGRTIRVAWPPEGADFNDVLRGVGC